MDVRRISELQCLATRSNGTMSAMSAVSHAWQKVLQGWEVQVGCGRRCVGGLALQGQRPQHPTGEEVIRGGGDGKDGGGDGENGEYEGGSSEGGVR